MTQRAERLILITLWFSLTILMLVLGWAGKSFGQSVQQSGNITPGHVAQWVTTGVIRDGGAPSGGVGLLGSFVIDDMLCASATGTSISVIDCGFSATGTNNWVGLQNLNGGATAPTRSPGDSTTNVATTAFVAAASAGAINPSVITIGPLPWVQAQNYAAGSSGSLLLGVHGTLASPVTNGVAGFIFQEVSTFAGTTPTVYVSGIKQSNSSSAYGIGIWSEEVDTVGGGSISGSRSGAFLTGGTGGNGTGSTNLAICTVSFAFCVGSENQAWNDFADATTSFSQATFSSPMLSSCSGTKKCDAGFLINPNDTSPDIWGFLAPAGTVDSTGSVFKSNTTSAHQVDLNLATCSTDCWLGPSGTSKIDGSGNITANGNITGSAALTAGGASGIFWAGRSAMSSPSDGIILLSNDAVTGFTRLQFGGTTSSFPAIKRNSTALNFRLADDSADAPITVGATTLSGQLVSTTGLPTIASGACGATTNGAVVAGSTNQSGNITIGSATTTTCTLGWSATLAVVPNACVFFPTNAAAAATGTTVARVSSLTNTNVVLTGSALANANYGYICL